MARSTYGASMADYGIDFSTGRPASGAAYQVWTAEVDGAQVTDVQQVVDGSVATVAAVTADDFGFIRFDGADGYAGDYWLQGATGTPRLVIRPTGLTGRVGNIETYLGDFPAGSTLVTTTGGVIDEAVVPDTIARASALTAGLAGKNDATKLPVLVRNYATGDGTTDDRAAILAAEAVAVAAGRALDFGGPENTYAISNKLTVASNRRWVGQGATLRPTAAFPVATVVEITGTSNVTIAGIRIDGNKAVATSAGALIGCASALDGCTIDVELVNGRTYGIQVGGAGLKKDWRITGRVRDCGSSAVTFQATSATGVRVQNMDIHDIGGIGIQFFGSTLGQYQDVVITGNRVNIGGATGSQIPMEITYVRGLTLTGNVISGAGLRGMSLGTLENFTVSGNSISGQDYYGMEMSKLERGSITGNVVYNCDSGFSGQSCVDLLIAGNLIHTTDPAAVNSAPHGVFIQDVSGAPAKRITIQGNVFVDIAGQGVRLTNAPQDVVVRGNTFITTAAASLVSDPYAVIVYDWQRGVVEDNTITTFLAGSGGSTVGMIHVNAAAVDVRIRRNTIRSGTGSVLAKAGIAVAAVGPTGLIVENNEVHLLATGVLTASATTDDAIVMGNRTRTCTTPYNLKAAHPRRTRVEYEGTAAPTTGTWLVGDIVWNTAVAAGGSPGWVCTTAGSPGTWKTLAVVAA